MHSSLIRLLFLAVGAAAAPAASTSACNEDNCLRAVQGTAYTTRHGTADCQSYFMTTVTPATSTSTVTVTATATTTDMFTITNTGTTTATIPVTVIIPETATVTVPVFAKRMEMSDLVRKPTISLAARQMTVRPSAIPSYASTCSGSVRYSSACSCIGVTATTTTAPTPITTTTVTVTTVQTSAVTQTSAATVVIDVTTTILDTVTVATVTASVCAGPTPTFVLSAVGGSFDGQYAQVINSGDGFDDVISFGPQSSASTFAIDTAGHIHVGNEYANTNTDPGAPAFLFYFNTPAQIAASNYVYASCSILPGDTLSCVDQTQTMFQTCPGLADAGSGVVLGSTVLAGCTGFTFMATCM
ncbi:hypothetical protein MMC11_006480 [Xylographa trunciseda]|nr:hypothetical protein [Xylographa trunciseda]